MPNPIGPDGIDVSGYGWTNQSTQFNSNLNLESYGNPTSLLLNAPSWNNYLGWSMITEDAIATTTHGATGTTQLTRIFVPVGGVAAKCDIWPLTNVANISAFYLSLYSATGTQLAITAESHAALVNGTQNSLSFAASAPVTNDTFYYVGITASWATGAPTFAGCTSANAATLNAGLTVSTAEAATATGTTVPPAASIVMASNTFIGFEYFVAIH